MNVGINRFVWNARYPDATVVPGAVFWAGGVTGPLAPPGRYTVELIVDGQSQSAAFDFVKDPRTAATAEDFAAQFALLLQIRDKLTETHEAINDDPRLAPAGRYLGRADQGDAAGREGRRRRRSRCARR